MCCATIFASVGLFGRCCFFLVLLLVGCGDGAHSAGLLCCAMVFCVVLHVVASFCLLLCTAWIY